MCSWPWTALVPLFIILHKKSKPRIVCLFHWFVLLSLVPPFPLGLALMLAVEAHRLMLCHVLRLSILARSGTQGPEWRMGCRNADEDGTSVRRKGASLDVSPLQPLLSVQYFIGLKPKF